MSQRRLVAVSWAMPPALFPRSIQISRLLKGLTHRGWRATVVTLEDGSRGPFDPIDAELARLYAPYYDLEPVPAKVRNDPPWDLRYRWQYGPLSRIDEHWILDAATAARREAWRDAEVLVTFAQPWRDHLVGLAFGRPRLPWVAHFSDPWVDSLYNADQSAAAREVDASHEAAVVRQCDVVVFTNEYARDLVMRKYPESLRSKARVISHAFDPDLGQMLTPRDRVNEARRPMRLAYVGVVLLGRRTANDLLAALAAVQSVSDLRNRLELVVVGSGSGTGEAQARVAELGLHDIVRFVPHVGMLESLDEMAHADVLVVLDAVASTNVFLPSKIADYVMMQRPIVAITPPVGPTADVMRAGGFHQVAPGDIEGASRVIRRLLDEYEAGVAWPPPPADVVARFHRDRVAAAFAAVLDEAVDHFSWKKRWL